MSSPSQTEPSNEPLTLHRHEPEDALGGCQYSSPFARYLTAALRVLQDLESGHDRRWWLNPHMAAWLREQMQQYRDGDLAFVAIWAVAQGKCTHLEAADAIGKREWWLREQHDRLNRYARTFKRLYREQGQRPPLAATA